MLIEFCCPVCEAALAIQKKTVGGQVNCPKCQKLILLPEASPLPRKDGDHPPFSPKVSHTSAEVSNAIKVSVEPYRRDLENKAELLNDAVEMIKTRNQRIKEIESLILNTQKDLWALEVQYEECKADYKRSQTHLHELRHQQDTSPDATEQKERITELTDKKERLKTRLSNLVAHSENLDRQLKTYRGLLDEGGDVRSAIDTTRRTLEDVVDREREGQKDLDRAAELLGRSADTIRNLHAELERKDRERRDLEDLVKSSSQDMQHAVDERKQWQKHSRELEKTLEDQQKRTEELELRLAEALKLQDDLQEDRRASTALQKEMKENLEVLRDRLESEREEAARRLEATRTEYGAEAEQRTRALEEELSALKQDLEEAEASRDTALRNQQQLTEQSLEQERKIKDLKQKLRQGRQQTGPLENS